MARGRFGVNFGLPKNILLRGNDFAVGIQGKPFCPNEFYGPWDPCGQASLSKDPLKNKIYANSQKSEKLQVAPATSLRPSLFPLVAVPIPHVGPGGRGRSPLDPAHQPEVDAGRVRQHARTLQSRGLTRPLTPASTLPPCAAEPAVARRGRPFFDHFSRP